MTLSLSTWGRARKLTPAAPGPNSLPLEREHLSAQHAALKHESAQRTQQRRGPALVFCEDLQSGADTTKFGPGTALQHGHPVPVHSQQPNTERDHLSFGIRAGGCGHILDWAERKLDEGAAHQFLEGGVLTLLATGNTEYR